MSAHWIGRKKIEKFKKKTGVDFISGENLSGTTYYIMLCKKEILYKYNRKNNSYNKIPVEYRNYKLQLDCLKRRAEFLKII